MTQGSLAGLTVLVTRPQGLGEDLVSTIEARGGAAVLLPAITIEPVQPDTSELADLATIPAGGLAIFASRNAVAWGARFLPQPRPRVAAIGPSTANALEELGLTPDIRPTGFTTEHLLQQPELENLSGVRVFIIRGENGREALSTGLKARGARVRYLDVYRRRPALLDAVRRKEILAQWAAGGIHIYTATSGDIFRNLCTILGPEGEALLRNTPLVTVSARVLQIAEQWGHAAARLLADGPDDQSLADAIARWHAGAAPETTGAKG
ncbi:MAG TPA: uroporphyrinogen-III synthase [Chiayiivirga sp.]|nr:uroporphyrinogen-III synthase [Chiayiivirga sp.]